MRKAVLLLLPAALLAQQPNALLDTLTGQLKNTPLLRLDFTQTRTLSALSRPLKSNGSMVLSRDRGVIWQLKKPLALTYVVSPKGLVEWDSAGRRSQKSAKDVPAVAQMGRIFQSLLQGRWNAVEEYFTLTAEGRPGKWEITMTPKAQTASFMKRIQVSGSRYIDRIRVEEASGDRMDLAFEHHLAGESLTEAETRLFAFE